MIIESNIAVDGHSKIEYLYLDCVLHSGIELNIEYMFVIFQEMSAEVRNDEN